MNAQQDLRVDRVERSEISEMRDAQRSVWWLVCREELGDLWLRGRVLIFLIVFTLLMSFTAITHQWESQLSMIPPPEIVEIMISSTISFALFIGLIIGADSISGERERATLETLLLTPTSRRQIVIGKFLAALSPWPVAMALAIPYMVVMAQGDAILGKAILLGSILGSLLAIGFTALGMLVSMWSNSNRNSLFVSLLVYLLFLIPTLWPGVAQKGDLGYFLQQVNPMQATSEFLAKVIVNNRTVLEKLPYTYAATIGAIVLPALLIFYAAPRLRLEGAPPRLFSFRRRAAALLFVIGLSAMVSQAMPLHAAGLAAEYQPLEITVDLEHLVANTGDTIEFNTVVTNNGSEASRPFFVSMNIVKLGSGDPVDPEDWSPERSQAVDALPSGQSATQAWVVDTILKGNYMVYMTIIPIPDGPDSTTQTFSGMGIHITVNEVTRTNPGGVLPVAIGIPAALTLGTVLVRRRGRNTGVTDAVQSAD